MSLLRGFGGFTVLLLSAAVTGICVVGIVGLLLSFQSISTRVQQTSAGLDDGLQRASEVSRAVQGAVNKARADLADVRKESAGLGGGSTRDSRAFRSVRSLIQRQVGPDIDDLGGRLATWTDATVVVSSVLQSFQELPFRQTDRARFDQWKSWKVDVRQLSENMRRLEGLISDGSGEVSGPEITAATSAVDLALQQCQGVLDNWQSSVGALRTEVQEVTTQIRRWLVPTAIVVTFLVLWVAAGQISLFAHAWKWCKKGG